MTSSLRVILSIGFIFFIHQFGKAQIDNNQQYLIKTGIVDSLYSEILNESRKIYIQVPASYNPSGNQKYPVVIILDGEIFLPTVNDVQNYYSGGYTPEMVLVGIANDKNRVRDLTTSSITTKYGMPFNEKNGEADKFREFISEELIQYIEDKYPITNYRTLVGHSYGGLFTIYTLINHSHLFSNYLAIDPSLDWDSQKLLTEAKVAVSPGIGFGKYGEEYVRIALIENEKRIRQAAKNIKK